MRERHSEVLLVAPSQRDRLSSKPKASEPVWLRSLYGCEPDRAEEARDSKVRSSCFQAGGASAPQRAPRQLNLDCTLVDTTLSIFDTLPMTPAAPKKSLHPEHTHTHSVDRSADPESARRRPWGSTPQVDPQVDPDSIRHQSQKDPAATPGISPGSWMWCRLAAVGVVMPAALGRPSISESINVSTRLLVVPCSVLLLGHFRTCGHSWISGKVGCPGHRLSFVSRMCQACSCLCPDLVGAGLQSPGGTMEIFR